MFLKVFGVHVPRYWWKPIGLCFLPHIDQSNLMVKIDFSIFSTLSNPHATLKIKINRSPRMQVSGQG